jgi:uncharacterized membrane protein YesL
MDSPLIKFLNIVADVAIISLLWVFINVAGFIVVMYGLYIGVLPVSLAGVLAFCATMGASTAAAYYVLTRRISNREGYILPDFFKAFKTNFKTSTLAFITLIPVLVITVLNIFNPQMYGGFSLVATAINIFIFAECIFVYIHVFPMASRFDMNYKRLMKAAFLIANKHLLTTFTHAVLFLSILVAAYMMPILILFAAGIYFWMSSHLLIRIYRKYRPEMDKDPDDVKHL